MTVSSPNVIEIKLDRLIDDMRFLRSQMIAFDRRLNGTERTTAQTQIVTMVRGRCWRDGKGSFVCSRGSSRGSLALSGNMTGQRR
jgi:hypothetical protein